MKADGPAVVYTDDLKPLIFGHDINFVEDTRIGAALVFTRL
jgi:hypothetical protein